MNELKELFEKFFSLCVDNNLIVVYYNEVLDFSKGCKVELNSMDSNPFILLYVGDSSFYLIEEHEFIDHDMIDTRQFFENWVKTEIESIFRREYLGSEEIEQMIKGIA